jgi:hypothetical protein
VVQARLQDDPGLHQVGRRHPLDRRVLQGGHEPRRALLALEHRDDGRSVEDHGSAGQAALVVAEDLLVAPLVEARELADALLAAGDLIAQPGCPAASGDPLQPPSAAVSGLVRL